MKINNLGAKWQLILELINKGYCTQSEIIKNSNGVLNGGVYIGLATLEEVGLIKRVTPEQFDPIAYINPGNTPLHKGERP